MDRRELEVETNGFVSSVWFDESGPYLLIETPCGKRYLRVWIRDMMTEETWFKPDNAILLAGAEAND